jgi:lipopolysaccharide transport system ATP-binding protein
MLSEPARTATAQPDIAVRVNALGKRYRLGAAQERFQYRTLRDTIAEQAGRLFRPRVSRTAEDLWALDDVSFSVGRGEVVGIIGRNGAGKSTLLKILSRITRPTRGFAEVSGRLGSLLEVGTGFHPELTGRDNIFLNGAILGMRREEIAGRFDAIVDFSGVGRFLDTPVKRYSSGMYVRLAFAVAAHLEPDILVVDEVLAVGDAEFQKKCLGKMESIVGQGRTILFVSHNMAAVKSLCRRVLLLESGRVVSDGDVDTVVDRYLQGVDGAPADGIVPVTMHRIGSGEARVRRIELLDRGGQPLSRLYLGQPFRIALTIESSAPVDDALIGLGISTLDGTRIASWFSTDCGQPLVALLAGWHRIAVDVDLTLLPRAYSLDCSLIRSSGYDIDTLQRVLDFTALDVAESGTDVYRWSNVRGYVRPAGAWHAVETVAPPSGGVPTGKGV